MKRLLLLCTLALAACSRGEQLGTGPQPDTRRPGTPVRENLRASPTIRVGIALDTPTISVGAPSDFEVRTLTGQVLGRGRGGETWQLTRLAGARVRVANAGAAVGEFDLPVRITTQAQDFIEIGGKRYRGTAVVNARGEEFLNTVNVVDLELYLLGVVPFEMGRRPASEIEALKAQAIAARTYAIGNIGGREDQGFDYYATVMDQVYGGVSGEDTIVSRAVTETRGEIVTYEGRPIFAYYSSTCGGHTADVEESWPARNIRHPYLRGVSDRIPGSDEYYCSSSSRFRWRNEWTREQLLAVLGQTLAAHTRGAVTRVERVDDVRLVKRPEGAERATIELVADGKSYTVRADSIRWVLRPQPGGAILNSSLLLSLGVARDGGQVERLTVEGGGWGHAIGMCQVGAMGRARAGHSYRQILQAYYTNTSIERLY